MRPSRLFVFWAAWAIPTLCLPRPQKDVDASAESNDKEGETLRAVGTSLLLTGAGAIWAIRERALASRLQSMEKQLGQINERLGKMGDPDGPFYDHLQNSRRQIEGEIRHTREQLEREMHRSNDRLGHELRREMADPGGKQPQPRKAWEPRSYDWRHQEYFDNHPERRDCIIEELRKLRFPLAANEPLEIDGLDWNEVIQQCLPPPEARWFYIHPNEVKVIGSPNRPHPRFPNPLRRPRPSSSSSEGTGNVDREEPFTLGELGTSMKDGVMRYLAPKPSTGGGGSPGTAGRRPVGIR